MVSDDNILIELIQDNFNHLREDLHNRLDKIENKLDSVITIEDCKKNRKSCIESLQLKKSEISIKKLTAVGGIVTGTITASSIIVITVLKIFFPI